MTITMTVGYTQSQYTPPFTYSGTGKTPAEATIKLLESVSASVDLDAEALTTLLETLAEALTEGTARHCEMGGDDEFEITCTF